MTEIVTARDDVLDFRARPVDVPDAPGPWRPVWTAKLQVSAGATRLHAVHDRLLLVHAPSGVVAFAPDPPGRDRALPGERVHARPAVDGVPVLIDGHGRIHRLGPADVAAVWETRVPGHEVDAIGLASGRLLVQRPDTREGRAAVDAAGGVTELVDPAQGSVVWRRAGRLGGVLPADDALYAILPGSKAVARLRLEDGREEWRRTFAERGASELIALVSPNLWFSTDDGDIVAMDAATGAPAARLRVPLHPVPTGVVDERGRLHLCHHARYTVLDLAGGGAQLAAVDLPVRRGGPSQVVAPLAMPTRDGRLVFFDVDGGVYAARPGSSDLMVLRQPALPLLSCRAGQGLLYVLTRSGELSALGPGAREE